MNINMGKSLYKLHNIVANILPLKFGYVLIENLYNDIYNFKNLK